MKIGPNKMNASEETTDPKSGGMESSDGIDSSEQDEKSTVSACTAAAVQQTYQILQENKRVLGKGNRHKLPSKDLKHPRAADNDSDVVNQNLCNKRNEKLSKPCENGNCYCYTSESEDIPKARRHKNHKLRNSLEMQRNFVKSRDNETKFSKSLPNPLLNQKNTSPRAFQRKHCNVKVQREIKEEASRKLLIHIVQEFHKDSVISKVTVNKNKIISTNSQFKNIFHVEVDEKTSSPKKKQLKTVEGRAKSSAEKKLQFIEEILKSPKRKSFDKNGKNKNADESSSSKYVTAEKDFGDSIGQDKCARKNLNDTTFEKQRKTRIIYSPDRFIKEKKLNSETSSLPDSSINGSNNSSLESALPKRRSSDKAGLLLQKRLSRHSHNGVRINNNTNIQYPPIKPPRQLKTIENIEEAQKVLDKFISKKSLLYRKSYPVDDKLKREVNNTCVPSCPTLSDIDEIDKPEEIGWNTETILKMINAHNEDTFFRKQSKAQPQNSKMGWTMPELQIQSRDSSQLRSTSNDRTSKIQSELFSERGNDREELPEKLNIDTVDGLKINHHNFVKNMESKSTPMKTELIRSKSAPDTSTNENKFNSLSFREKATKGTKIFLKTSKQKIAEFVGKTNRNRKEHVDENLSKKNVAVQTSVINLAFQNHSEVENQNCFSLQSPPGSYHSPNEKNNSANKFDFSRTISSPKMHNSNRRLNFSPKKLIRGFASNQKNTSEQAEYYKSYQSDLNGDFTLTAMNDILLNIKSKLEASDEHAELIFGLQKETNILQNPPFEAIPIRSKTDLLSDCEENSIKISAQADIHNEPIYSEIEEDKILVTGTAASIHNLKEIPHYVVNNSAIYAEITKSNTSFNNINERHSSPKNRNLSKSDLTIGPEAFLNNLAMDQQIQDKKEVSYESPADVSYYDINQSTPKKDIDEANCVLTNTSTSEFGFDMVDDIPRSISCPPSQQLPLKKLNENIFEDSISMQNDKNFSSKKLKSPRYQNFKNKFQNSIRRGKFYLKNSTDKEHKKIEQPNQMNCIENFYAQINNEPSVQRQLERAVQLCRSNLRLENSVEAAEAERLLLFSSLKNLKYERFESNNEKSDIFVNQFELCIRNEVINDLFFNYFYIGVFSEGNRVRSTNFPIKGGNIIFFENCKILFDKLNTHSLIKCDIYILRLRRVLNSGNFSTSGNDSTPLKIKNDMSDSSDEVHSKFKLHGTFVIKTEAFAPYEFSEKDQNSTSSDFFLSGCKEAKIPVEIFVKKSPIENYVTVKANLKFYFNKFHMEGFLNVRDVKNKHFWNRRWCKLNFFKVDIWNDPQDYENGNNSITSFDILQCSNLELTEKDDCARSRSFKLVMNEGLKVFLAADNQNELTKWLEKLNDIIDFSNKWIKKN